MLLKFEYGYTYSYPGMQNRVMGTQSHKRNNKHMAVFLEGQLFVPVFIDPTTISRMSRRNKTDTIVGLMELPV